MGRGINFRCGEQSAISDYYLIFKRAYFVMQQDSHLFVKLVAYPLLKLAHTFFGTI